jgi:hypothetical protein
MRYVQANGTEFLRHLNDNEPTTFSENHNCRPSKLTSEEAIAFGVSKLKLVTPPFHDPLTQIRTDGPALLVGGVWTQNWLIEDMPVDEAAAYRVIKDAEQAASVRTSRNQLLNNSDWTQVSDAPVEKAVWATYRQALRDVTAQSGFPWTITWPDAPQ